METSSNNRPRLYGQMKYSDLVKCIRDHFSLFLRPDPDKQEWDGLPYSVINALATVYATDTQCTDGYSMRFEADWIVTRCAYCASMLACHWNPDLPEASTSTIASVLINHAVTWEIADTNLWIIFNEEEENNNA